MCNLESNKDKKEILSSNYSSSPCLTVKDPNIAINKRVFLKFLIYNKKLKEKRFFLFYNILK